MKIVWTSIVTTMYISDLHDEDLEIAVKVKTIF